MNPDFKMRPPCDSSHATITTTNNTPFSLQLGPRAVMTSSPPKDRVCLDPRATSRAHLPQAMSPQFTYTQFRGTSGVAHMQNKTPLSMAYFSDQNMQIIQNAMRRNVYEQTGTVIAEQNALELQTVMRSIFFEHAQHLPENIAGQISQLNDRVIAYATPNIISTLRAQRHYLKTIDEYPTPIERPVPVRNYTNRALENTRVQHIDFACGDHPHTMRR